MLRRILEARASGRYSPPAVRRQARCLAAALSLSLFSVAQPSALTMGQPATPGPQAPQKILVTVLDENGVPVPSAQVTLTQHETQKVFKGESDYAGRREFTELLPGLYSLRVEKEGFYVLTVKEVRVSETANLDVTLNHTQEYVESVDVVYSPPAIDLAKTSASEGLSSQDIINLPYPVTRDIRYALPMIPGVLQDAFGQLHLDGSSTRQVFDQLDGFNINDPVTGLFNMRVSVDALRSADVQSSRSSAEYGKGSGGVISLRTSTGDNRFRYSATDFFPSLQNRKGFHINTWTPRATFSGPLRKDKAWFLEAFDGEYSLSIVKELPAGADQSPAWRMSNLTKAHVNLTPSNHLATSLLVNGFRSDYAGLGPFSPLETTVNETESAYLLAVKDQALLPRGLLLETGLGVSQFRSRFRPLGVQTYVIHPDRTSGNFFETAHDEASRIQGIANLFLPPTPWHGRHEFKVGLDLDRDTDSQSFERRPILIVREDGTLSRRITFAGGGSFTRNNFEASAYAQDRWTISDRCLIEPGVRFDWDEVVRETLVSPRLASTLLLSAKGDTKLAWGIGIYHDASNLDMLTRSLTGRRTDLFYDLTGQALARPPVETTFSVSEQDLKEPRFLNWSVGLERKMPGSIHLRLQYVQKRGWDGWTFINVGANQPGGFSGQFELKNERRDRYDALEITARRVFKGDHAVFASYTRSAARSTAVLNFNIDNPLFSQQAGGPLPWNTPNRFISWGWLPLRRGFDLAYSLDWRDGYPFGLVNDNQQLVGLPGSHRFPTYFSLNLQVERRVRLLGFVWALRAGLDDITNRGNPSAVDSNVDSPHFLTFSGIGGRALTARIRLLGRK